MKCMLQRAAVGAAAVAAVATPASALVLSSAPKTTSTKSSSSEQQIKKLETIMSGMKRVIAANAGSGESKIGDTLSPFVAEVEGTLNEVKTPSADAKPLSEEEKQEKLKAAQLSMQHLAEAIAKRGEALEKESSMDKTNLLMGVLLSRKDSGASLAEQYEVLEDEQFANLDVVRFVDAQKDSDMRALVEQCGEFLDAPGKYVVAGKPRPHVAHAHHKHHAASAALEEAKRTAVSAIKVQIKVVEKKLAEHKKLHSGTGHEKDLEKMSNTEVVKDLTWIKSEMENLRDLKQALVDVSEGNMQGLEKVKKQLEAGGEAENEKNVALIQMQASLHARDCPYCKAQCFEKETKKGKSYMQAMTVCAAVGN